MSRAAVRKCNPDITANNDKTARSWDDNLLLATHEMILREVKKTPSRFDATGRAYHRSVRRELRRRGLL